MVRVLVALSLAGCTHIFGLDPPHRTDAKEDAQLGDSNPMGDSTTVVDAPADAATAACPAGYTMSTSTTGFYRVVSAQLQWVGAANDCGDDGITTHLVVISSDLELQVVDGIANNGAWIG